MKGRIAALAVVLLAAPFVAEREGVILSRYKDPIGIPTACAGETDSEVVGFKKLFSRDECIALMGASLYSHAIELDKCIHVPVARHQAAAILSWGYNIGTTAACKSTLIRLVNKGASPDIWCKELRRWTFAGSIKLPGLVKRREAEYRMCMGE